MRQIGVNADAAVGGREMTSWKVVAIAVSAVVWLVTQRYFDYKETRYLLERTEEWSRHLELRERWKTRRGMLTGIVVLLLGLALFYWYSGTGFTQLNSGQIGFLETIGWFLILVGIVITAAHAIWSRGLPSPICGSPASPTRDAENDE
jgi:hypothetical protein